MRERAQAGNADAALALVERARGMTPGYAALLRADIALVLFRRGEDARALRIAAEGARMGSPARRLRRRPCCLGHRRVRHRPRASSSAPRGREAAPALRSAAAFWTARAAIRARRPELYTPWMMQAAQESRTFYGLVARRSLGLPANFAWEGELAGDADLAPVAETAGGWRALALLQIGQPARAEAELRLLWSQARNHPGLVRAMLGVATVAGLDGLSSQLAAASQSADGRPRDFARYPLPRLQPQGGFRVDPALLYAIALQESRFDAGAVSPAGARGLMQMMPTTASHVTGDPSWREPAAAQRLNEPGLSLDLGQRYVHHLARIDGVEGNLIRLLAAYNAGPGNLLKWLPVHGHRDDPFLFIEAIPLDETRAYLHQVLAYSWIYASRLGLPSRSLDQIAAGEFPRFAGPEEVTAMLRREPQTALGGAARRPGPGGEPDAPVGLHGQRSAEPFPQCGATVLAERHAVGRGWRLSAEKGCPVVVEVAEHASALRSPRPARRGASLARRARAAARAGRAGSAAPSSCSRASGVQRDRRVPEAAHHPHAVGVVPAHRRQTVPPGRTARRISAAAFGWSGTKFSTRPLATASKAASATGSARASPAAELGPRVLHLAPRMGQEALGRIDAEHRGRGAAVEDRPG